MKNKLLTIVCLACVLIAGLVPTDVLAASTVVYVSPGSKSVVKGSNVTVQVRISCGSSVDSIQSTINYSTSKLQYVSYSGGAFTSIQANPTSGAFSYVGTILGGSVTGDQLVFSITFRALATGTASLSLSGVSAAYQGSYLGSVTSSGGTITITAPAVTPPATDTSDTTTDNTADTTTNTTTTTDTAAETKDTDPPKLSGKASVTFDKHTITIKFKTNEKAKTQTTYKTGNDSKSLNDNRLSTDHTIVIGTDSPLLAGSTYTVSINAVDGSGNKATVVNQKVRTTGVDYSVTITDSAGKPLANYPVELHSDPITATTDANGVATFQDVTPGKHTISLEIDGLTVNQPVTIAQESTGTNVEQTASATPNAVKLPFNLVSSTNASTNKTDSNLLIAITVSAAICGAAIASLAQIAIVRRALGWAFAKISTIFAHVLRRP